MAVRQNTNRSIHILVLTDRDWTHPQGGGTGTNLYGQISRWVGLGHRVTVVAGIYPGASKTERFAPNLTVHRMGSRLTVFPRAAWAVRRGLAADADVVLEVINGIAFFTPLWLRKPHVSLVHHVHRRHYVTELGKRGAAAAWLLERLPLRFLYRGVPVITISQAAKRDLIELGVPEGTVHVSYLGVEIDHYRPGTKARTPTLLYLGRLKRYKRIELILDVLEAIPTARLDIAGEGDYRPELEAEIARRNLGERITLHGHVSEAEKVALYGRAWVSLTASSAEGWSLAVMEAAACKTPSAALAVGGLPESIVDGQTGVLADTTDELKQKVRELISQPERLKQMGEAAYERAKSFTWERTAHENLKLLQTAVQAGRQRPLTRIAAGSHTVKAFGLAVAAMAANCVALLFTVIFTRILGAEEYGSLAALIASFLIVSVPGLAVQVAVARQTAIGQLGGRQTVAWTVKRWTGQLALLGVVIAAICALLGGQLAALFNVEERWAAAAVPVTGVIWFALSAGRGALQGLADYRGVGTNVIFEAIGRLLVGLLLVGAGLGVTGAYLGTPLAMLLALAALTARLNRQIDVDSREQTATEVAETRPLRSSIQLPSLLTLTFLSALQNLDVVVAKHQLSASVAGSYAAASVSAKAVIWVALGVALHLLPETARRNEDGDGSTRQLLLKALLLVTVISLPVLALFALWPETLLSTAFGEEFRSGNEVLPILGVAMVLLAATYLAGHYLLAIGRRLFLIPLGVAAIAEPLLLLLGTPSATDLALRVLAIEAATAVVLLATSLRSRN